MIDQVTLASIRGCKDATPILGSACTALCSYRSHCNIARLSFIIPTNNMKGWLDINKNKIMFYFHEFREWHSGHATVLTFQPDSQINDLFLEDEDVNTNNNTNSLIDDVYTQK